MSSPKLRSKPLCALKTNVRELPYRIGYWKQARKPEQAALAQKILDESKAELARRETLKEAA